MHTLLLKLKYAMVKIIINFLKGKIFITLTHKDIQITGFKVNPNSSSSPKFDGLSYHRVRTLSCLDITPILALWDKIYH